MVTFTVYRGDQIVQELDLQGPEITIGRNSANQVVLPDEGKGVSRDHATLRYEGGRYVLYDRNSKIGTLVDGKKIKRVALEPGQEFVIGPYRLVFNVTDESSSGLRPTVVLPRPTPPPAPDVPAREGTEKRLGSGSTQSTHPAGRSQTLGARATGAMAWVTRQPPSLLYTAGVVALVLFGAMLFWLFQPVLPPQDPPISQVITSSSTTTTSIPEQVVDVHAEDIALAEGAIIEAEDFLANGRFKQAISAFDSAVKEHLTPVLTAEPSHVRALELQQRANGGAQDARNRLAPVKTIPPSGTNADYGQNPIERLASESEDAYVNENQRANKEWDAADFAFRRGDYMRAYKLFDSLKRSLATRQSTWRDIDSRMANVARQWDTVRSRTFDEAATQENTAWTNYKSGQYATAVDLFLEAKKGYEAALALEHPAARKEIDGNLARRRELGEVLSNDARSHSNTLNSGQAVKLCELLTRLLAVTERSGIDSLGVCKKLGVW